MTPIDQACAILRAGGLVAFPTETVYGLGADARNAVAVKRIFAAKGRPATNPLIVHVSGVAMAKLYANEWPDAARRLAQRFWPGPLTLVLPRFRTVAPEVSAGLNTVALRMPDHPLALALIQKFDGPLAAPSANRSTRVSPTTAEHVRQELGDRVDLILDGGPCAVGIESTVIDLTARPRPVILRPGGVTREQIEKVIGPVHAPAGVVTSVTTPAASPGQHEVHYAPRAPAFRFERADAHRASRWLADHPGEHVVVLSLGAVPKEPADAAHRVVEMSASPESYARHLYATLRAADEAGAAAIWVEMPPDEPVWVAVRDRLRRATKPG